MACKLISGPEVSSEIYGELRARIETLKSQGTTPGLAVILVGDDPASQIYVRNKGRKCEELGMRSETIVLSKENEKDILDIKPLYVEGLEFHYVDKIDEVIDFIFQEN